MGKHRQMLLIDELAVHEDLEDSFFVYLVLGENFVSECLNLEGQINLEAAALILEEQIYID